jgi:MFS family permease
MQNKSFQNKKTDWRGIVALNIISTLSQLGQFGVGFIVMPIWLAFRHVEPVQLGFFGAVEWFGMLIALLITPKLLKKRSSKEVILLSLTLTSLGLVLVPFSSWPSWLISAFLIGFGMGLRWIANETWLYRKAPKNILGQIVGIHEALIALSVIIPPALVFVLSTANNNILYLGVMFNLLAALPLLALEQDKKSEQSPDVLKASFFKMYRVTKLGILLAGGGGLIDGALISLFPVFGLGRHFSEEKIALLLTVIGVGGLLLQYPLGLLSDRKGFISASLLAAVVAFFVTGVMAFVSIDYHVLAVLSFVFGGVTASFLTFGTITAASAANDGHMAENISKISISFTVFSIIGALLAGYTSQLLGTDALLWLVILVSGVLSLLLFKNKHRLTLVK